MEGRRKNKFKEQRHQGKLSAFLRLLQGKGPWRKGSCRSGCWERLGDHRVQLNDSSACVCGTEHDGDISGPGVVRESALWVVKVELCPRDRDIKES